MNSHSDSESPTESGRDGGSNALKPLKTAAAELVCGQNLQLLGLMDARRDADAGRRAVCGQRVPGSAPDLHDGIVLLQQSLSRKNDACRGVPEFREVRNILNQYRIPIENRGAEAEEECIDMPLNEI